MKVNVRNIQILETADKRYPFAVEAEIHDIVNDGDYVIRKVRSRNDAERIADRWANHGIKH